MPFTNILGIADTWSVIKIMFLVGMFIYIIFAFVVVKQIENMTKTLSVGFETPIRLLGIFHFLASVIVFIIALFYL